MKAVPHGVDWCSSNIRWLLLLLLFFFFNWGIIALQCRVSFCYTMKWSSHVYTYLLLFSLSVIMSNSLWPIYCSLPGSSVHGIFQARILEWVAISSSRGSSGPRDWTPKSQHILHSKRILYCWATSIPSLLDFTPTPYPTSLGHQQTTDLSSQCCASYLFYIWQCPYDRWRLDFPKLRAAFTHWTVSLHLLMSDIS